MNNRNFDALDKQLRLAASREAVVTWKAARARTDLSIDDKSWLDRAITDAEEQVKRNRHAVREWWT